jgi:Carboxypeptidase regulatory-like domain
MRFGLLSSVAGLCLMISMPVTLAYAQTGAATVTGEITDSQGKVVPGVTVVFTNINTGIQSDTTTNGDGIYSLPALQPGVYRANVTKDGFKGIVKTDIGLHVQDQVSINFSLEVGSMSETVTVNGSGLQMNTTDGSVSTVIDSKFVENTPLNGRSFQSLILLTPGTVTDSPQNGSNVGITGEFSVNGQRTDSNYYTVDGISANNGVTGTGSPTGASGSLPAATALGTTQALVSVDALQEFRVESSTYSAEYGRSPGGQFAMVTRSGSNDWHGTGFDYFRNDVMDANNWFNDHTTPITPKSAEHQNDFGGTLGGAIRVPHIYNGRDKTFFFFSYEGLRLLQPVAANISYVPTLALRDSTSGALNQALAAFPLPSPNAPDLGNGLTEFIGAWSSPSSIDAISIRVDHNIGQNIQLFFRQSQTPSNSESRGSTLLGGFVPSNLTNNVAEMNTYTLGADVHLSHNTENELRLNYTSNSLSSHSYQDDFGGAVPVDFTQLQDVLGTADVGVTLGFAGYNSTSVADSYTRESQAQWNLVDSTSINLGKHIIKVGFDWRRLAPHLVNLNPLVSYSFDDATQVAANSVGFLLAESMTPAYPLYKNFSAFVEDAWPVAPRLSVSLGLRWDVNPAPGVTQGLMPYTVTELTDVAQMALAPQGTPLWKTDWFGVAPRLGVAYEINNNPGQETVIRGGFGVFYDTGTQTGSYGFEGDGFDASNYLGADVGAPISFPAPASSVTPAIVQPPPTPYQFIYTYPSRLQLPYTLQWNLALERALGRRQSVTVSYVGSDGRKLLQETFSQISALNPDFTFLTVFKNGLTSNYNALQVKFQRQVGHGLQALASYTWSHSLDYGSYNYEFPYERGNSDFDVRHNLAAGVSYELPSAGGHRFSEILTSGWGIDGRLTARTGFPVTLLGNSFYDPMNGQRSYSGLNIVPGEPLYVYGAQYPGGRRINPAAFSLPASGQAGDAPRNFVNGLGALQVDVAVRRTFQIHDGLQGVFRVEAFNALNHPNFGYVNPTYCSGSGCTFGEATAVLAQSLGTLSPLYQMGGPRSVQLALKLTF